MSKTENSCNRYFWTIDVDFQDFNLKGVQGPSGELCSNRKNESVFELLDDDGRLYCKGRIFGKFTGFEPLDDFGLSLGCTTIKINGEIL